MAAINKVKLRELSEAGHSYGEIAEMTGLSRSSVSGAIWRLKHPKMHKLGVTDAAARRAYRVKAAPAFKQRKPGRLCWIMGFR